MKLFQVIYFIRNKIKIQRNNQLIIGNNVGLSGCTIIIKGQNNHLLIGDNSRLRNMTIEIVGNNCTVEIGTKCIIGHGCYLSAKENNINLIIGNDCMLSRNINILTSDGHPILQKQVRINPAKNITLGNHVWLADNVTILKGISIGDNSVVGIHSLVTKSIPENSIAVGIPAKIIKKDINWKI